MNKILSLSIKNVSEKIRIGELRPSQIFNASSTLLENITPLNAYIHVTHELGKKQSVDSDNRQIAGKLLGNLDGIPIAIKDNFCVQDEPTTCGSLMLANFVPGYSSSVYQKLQNNGAVLMGKTNLDEFAMGSGTVDSYFGPTKNIWGSALLDNYAIEDSNLLRTNKSEPNNWYIAGN